MLINVVVALACLVTLEVACDAVNYSRKLDLHAVNWDWDRPLSAGSQPYSVQVFAAADNGGWAVSPDESYQRVYGAQTK